MFDLETKVRRMPGSQLLGLSEKWGQFLTQYKTANDANLQKVQKV